MAAWDRFFCMNRGADRPVSMKVRVGANAVRCQVCINNATTFNRGRGRPARPRDESDDSFDVPADIAEAYREAISE